LKWAGIRDQRSGIRKPDPTGFCQQVQSEKESDE